MLSHLQELATDVMERSNSMSKCKILMVVMIRIATNAFVFVCLIAGGAAIFYSVQVVSYSCVCACTCVSQYQQKWMISPMLYVPTYPKYNCTILHICLVVINK